MEQGCSVVIGDSCKNDTRFLSIFHIWYGILSHLPIHVKQQVITKYKLCQFLKLNLTCAEEGEWSLEAGLHHVPER